MNKKLVKPMRWMAPRDTFPERFLICRVPATAKHFKEDKKIFERVVSMWNREYEQIFNGFLRIQAGVVFLYAKHWIQESSVHGMAGWIKGVFYVYTAQEENKKEISKPKGKKATTARSRSS